MFCQYCGRQLSDEAAFCPHCGAKLIKTDNTAPRQNAATQYGTPQSAPIPQVPVQPQKLPLNGFGIASFVIGIVCLVLGVWLFWAAIAGIILGAVAVALWHKYSLNGLAVAGLVISCVALVLWALIWFWVLVCSSAIYLFLLPFLYM